MNRPEAVGQGNKMGLELLWCVAGLSGLALLGYVLYGKRLKREIEEKNRSIEALAVLQQQQDFFIRKMIHEMNTPLSAIELNVSVLMRDYPAVKNLEMIRGSARVLSTIYDDIAYMCRKERLVYPVEPIDLETFIADRVLYFDAMASVKEILIEMDIEAGSTVRISRTELQRLIDNNLSNALKYTQRHGELIVIGVARTKDGGIELAFRDNGVGMSPEELEKVFEMYYHGNAHHMGLGLGMSIVRDICDHYRIKSEINSVKGEGSTFIYRFPTSICLPTSTQHS